MLILTLQDNVLLPDDFAEHIYHVGNSHDLHSIIQSGLIPGGKSIKKERHAAFFTAVNPMFVDQHKEVEVRPDESQDCSVPEYLEIYQKYSVYWCDLKVAQKKGLQFYETRSNAIVLYNTLPAMCIEKVVYMKCRRRIIQQSVSISKVTAKSRTQAEFASWTSGSWPNLEARTSVNYQSKESEEYGETRGEEFEETRSGNIDFRIQGLPHSTVQQEEMFAETQSRNWSTNLKHTQIASRWWQTKTRTKIQSVQREIEGINPQHGKHGVLRDVRDHF